jgi:hypothetical protein
MTPNRTPSVDGRGRRIIAASVRQARIARVNLIRRRVIAGALALFVATWMLITLTLVTGHDPALARQRAGVHSSARSATSTPSTTAPAATTPAATTPAVSSSTTSSSSSSSGSAAGSSGLSAVTSSQS